MQKWWIEKQHILVRDNNKLQDKYPGNNFKFEIRDDHLWLVGTILDDFEFECQFPQSYPSAPPSIYPKDRSTKYVKGHQYKNSRFCLDIRKKDWSSNLSSGDILNSLEVLLKSEKIRIDTQANNLDVYEEPEPTIIDNILNYPKWIFPSDIILPIKSKYGFILHTIILKSNSYQFLVAGYILDGNEIKSEIIKLIWPNAAIRNTVKSLWVTIDNNEVELLLIKEPLKLVAYLADNEYLPSDFNFNEYIGDKEEWYILIYFNNKTWLNVIAQCNTKKNTIKYNGIYNFDIEDLMKRIPNDYNYLYLKNKKVTIIGCGTGGSIDAEYLVKSGIAKLVLIDNDIIKTENVIRHACQLDSISFYKVDALENKLKKINPDIEITVIKEHLDIIDDNTHSKIFDSDLMLIETAENEKMFNYYAYTNNIPAIYAKVYPQGFGGEIIRVIPGITPCYECTYYLLNKKIDGKWPNKKFPEYNQKSYDIAENDDVIPIPALAIDSDFISLIASKMALEILLTKDKMELENSIHIRLWGNKKEWIFTEEFQLYNYAINCDCLQNCFVSHGEEVIKAEMGKTSDELNNDYLSILGDIKQKDE